MYLKVCVAQLVIEILFFTTIECAWVNFFVPLTIQSEFAVVRTKLKQLVLKVSLTGTTEAADTTDGYELNAPDYFFASCNLARSFPTSSDREATVYIKEIDGCMSRNSVESLPFTALDLIQFS